MRSIMNGIGRIFCLGVLTLLFISCGGDEGGFTEANDVLTIQIRTADGSNDVSWNPTLEPFSFDTRQPFTKNIVVEVRDEEGNFFPAELITVDILPSTEHGSLFTPIPPGGDIEDAGPFSRAILEETSGIAELFFIASNKPGQVRLTASTLDPASGDQISASLTLNVVGGAGPVASMRFTGPFINAVQAGAFTTAITPGEAILADGSYQRIVSVIATDENGNPPIIGTPINFFLIDAPVTGFPAGSGEFFVAGSNGDPLEGGFDFFASSGQFQSKDVLPGNRLVLDGENFGFQPNNRALTGIRTIAGVTGQNSLFIDRSGIPFNVNPVGDTGPTVPYVIGRAEQSNILSSSFTDSTGTASTFLSYPARLLGRTALLVACTEDRSVCTVLNTCDANGENCGSVFLPVSDGTNVVLTTSAESLGPNTTTPLTLCLRDVNFAPLQATPISFEVESFLGSAKVFIRETLAEIESLPEDAPSDLSDSFITGSDGCVTIFVRSSGQIPGSEPIPIFFDADGVAEPVQVEIQGPGEGKLTGNADCDLTEIFEYNAALAEFELCLARLGEDEDPAVCGDPPTPPTTLECTIDLFLTDDRGAPIPGIVVTHTVDGTILVSISYEPPFGTNSGITDANGEVAANVVYQTGGETTIEFSAGSATFEFTLNTELEEPSEP